MEECTGTYEDYLKFCIYGLQEHYKDKDLTIIGLNDSQGVNTTPTFFKKGLLEYIASSLSTKDINPTVINAFSLLMNKTEHVNYFLENNLSLEEIKFSQVYSAVSSLEKVMEDIGLPKTIGNIGYLYSLIYRINKEDCNIKITSELKNSQEPILIYSSGVNNLMREVHNNPFAIKKDYKKREEKPNFYYTIKKSKDPKTLKTVMENIDKNLYNILTINDKTDIYTLGAYVPPALQIEEMNVFKDLILRYNEYLEKLCKLYQITFIDTENIGKSYNKSKINFHISSKGHNELANYILTRMYENKRLHQLPKATNNIFEISNNGAKGIMDVTYGDYLRSLSKAEQLSGYEKEVELKIAREHQRETEVFKKILVRK